MKLLLPLVPHLANECLHILNCKDINIWPKIDEKKLEDMQIKLVVQINGKTRDILEVKKDISEKDLNKLTAKSTKLKKYLVDHV